MWVYCRKVIPIYFFFFSLLSDHTDVTSRNQVFLFKRPHKWAVCSVALPSRSLNSSYRHMFVQPSQVWNVGYLHPLQFQTQEWLGGQFGHPAAAACNRTVTNAWSSTELWPLLLEQLADWCLIQKQFSCWGSVFFYFFFPAMWGSMQLYILL